VGFITGSDSSGVGGPGCVGADCSVTIVDVVLTADPTDDLSLWANFDYINNAGAPGEDGSCEDDAPMPRRMRGRRLGHRPH